MVTSQNGWPALQANSSLLYTWQITEHTRIRVRNGSAGFLLSHFARKMDGRVEDIDYNYQGGALDDWGYAYRAVRGYTTVSNHSSGTAMDLNATEHPLGREGTFTPKEELVIHRLLHRYDGALRWGGDYNSRKDEMHVELNVGLAEAERVARKLMNTEIGEWLLEHNPGQRGVILS